MELNEQTVERMRISIERTWCKIDQGFAMLCTETNLKLTNESAIRGCVEANRLEDYGNDPAGNKLFQMLVAAHGREKTLQFLYKNICLLP